MGHLFDSSSRIPRRAMLWRCLSLLGLWRRSASGSTISQVTGYDDLKRPVTISLKDVAESWQPVSFDAYATDATGGGLLLKGMLLRTAQASDEARGLKAFCLLCPHEICHVNLVEDTKAVRVDTDVRPNHPLLVCPCHFSVFDPVADGAQLAGPADRGLFRFRLQVEEDAVRIDQVEAEILRFFA